MAFPLLIILTISLHDIWFFLCFRRLLLLGNGFEDVTPFSNTFDISGVDIEFSNAGRDGAGCTFSEPLHSAIVASVLNLADAVEDFRLEGFFFRSNLASWYSMVACKSFSCLFRLLRSKMIISFSLSFNVSSSLS